MILLKMADIFGLSGIYFKCLENPATDLTQDKQQVISFPRSAREWEKSYDLFNHELFIRKWWE